MTPGRGVRIALCLCALGWVACGGEDMNTARPQPSVMGPETMGPQAGAVGAMGGQGAGPSVGGQMGPTMPPSQGVGMPGAGGAGGMTTTGGSMAVPMGGAGGMMAGGAGGMMTAGAGGSAGSMAPIPSGDLCARWKAARTNLMESAWTGNAAMCMAGDMTAEDRMKAHTLHSLYRQMAGLEPVEMTDEGNRLAQGCALLMAANGKISHTPDSSWKCFTDEAAKTASSSSLSSGGAISSVDGYMIDPGNPTTIGHRRWILSNMLSSVGYGSAGRFSCQYQPAKRPAAGAKAWVAWPPAGQIPVQAMGSRFATIDSTGWTIQSDTISFAGATVTVTVDGMNQPVTVTQLDRGYGSTNAMRFNPMGWTTAANKKYHVKVDGISMPIEYDVEVVDCP